MKSFLYTISFHKCGFFLLCLLSVGTVKAQIFSDQIKEVPPALEISNSSDSVLYFASFGDLNNDKRDDCIYLKVTDILNQPKFSIHYQLNETENNRIEFSTPKIIIKNIPLVLPYLVDCNNDGLKDMLGTTEELDASSLQFLINQGSRENPVFIDSSIVQYDISAVVSDTGESYPILIDLNKDGNLDFFIYDSVIDTYQDTNDVTIRVFINDGIENKISYTYVGSNVYGLEPILENFNDLFISFPIGQASDFDNDGDEDILFMKNDAYSDYEALYIIENTSLGDNYSFALSDPIINSVSDLSQSIIFFAAGGDIDNDGDKDVLFTAAQEGIQGIEASTGYFENLTITSAQPVPLESIAIQVFPNPVRDRINVHLNQGFTGEQVEVKLYDMYGRVRYQGEFLSHKRVTIEVPENLAAGQYILQVKTGERIGRKILELIK